MATTRPFSYNTGTSISGTTQVGNLAVGTPLSGFTGMEWWNGPDEDLGYVIAQPVSGDTQPTPISGVTASVGFFRTSGFNDTEFIDIANILLNENYINAPDASTGLTSNGYWNSYTTIITSGLTLSLDAGNPLSYPGTGSTWTDTISGKTFTLFNSPTYSSNDGGYLLFTPASGQYAQSNSLPSSLSKWTVEVWHYYTATNSGSLPSIITELFPGVTSKINFNLGSVFTSPGGLESGFFDGSWRVTASYSLTANAWYYIVGTYDGATNKLYINNTLVSSTSFTGTPTSSQGGIRLMRRWDLPDYWGGRLGIVRIYNRSLSETEVTQNFNNNKSRFGL